MRLRLIVALSLVALILSLPLNSAAQKRPAIKSKSGAAAGGSAQRQITLAASSLKKKNFAAALTAANKAIELKPTDVRGYTIAMRAYAGLEDYDNALSTGTQAKTACPPETASEIDTLMTEIAVDKAQFDRVRLADKYANEGNAAMAAKTLKEAWVVDPTRSDLGLKAATIFNDQVKDFDGAIDILNKMLLRTNEEGISAQAKDLLQVAENNKQTREQELARQREEQARKDAEERERRKQEEKERAQEAKRQQIEQQIKDLEYKRSQLESEISSAESFAEQQDGFAADWEQQAISYDNQPPLGPAFAVIARNKAKSAKSEARSYRQKAKDLQREITTIERQISALERQLN